MGKQTTTLRGFSRLKLNVDFFLIFFSFFSRKEAKMNLIFPVSILCLVSLVAGIPATGYERLKDFVGMDETDEANRQADERLPEDFANDEAQNLNRENVPPPRPRCIPGGRLCERRGLRCCPGFHCSGMPSSPVVLYCKRNTSGQ